MSGYLSGHLHYAGRYGRLWSSSPPTSRHGTVVGGRPQTREAILEAVRELLKLRRLDDLQVNEIVERAGISRQTFYVHFETKYSVIAALIADTGEGILEIWAPRVRRRRPDRRSPGPHAEPEHHRALACAGDVVQRDDRGLAPDAEIHDVWNAVLTQFEVRFAARVRRHRGGTPRRNDDMLVGALMEAFQRCLYLGMSVPGSAFARSDDDLADMLAALWAAALSD